MIFSYKRVKVSLFLFSWNRYKHQMIFFGFQLAQGKQLRAAYVISRSYGHPDFLSRLKFLLGDHSFFYPPSFILFFPLPLPSVIRPFTLMLRESIERSIWGVKKLYLSPESPISIDRYGRSNLT